MVLACAVLAALFFASPALGTETVVPHVSESTETAACAMCHRGHTSASDATVETSSGMSTQSALLMPASTGVGDTEMCYMCHGQGLLGSETDIQSKFLAGSGHSIAPSSSDFGPAKKQCSTCHDSHGSDKVTTGTAYPALLRRWDASGTKVFRGDEYCAACHPNRPTDRWDGLTVWRKTAHSAEVTAPTGTRIVCSACHDPHGSDVAPSIVTSMTTPTVAATTSIFANDRTFCAACHTTALDTWSGVATYAVSSHAATDATVAVPGEWPVRDLASGEATRKAGECQVCHAPMGRSDGTTEGVVPEMLERAGRALCDDCHDADGPAPSNVASLAFPASRADTEVIAVWRPSEETSVYGDAAVWTPDNTTAVPAALDGPRVFRPTSKTGPAAAGDIDDDGVEEVVVADRAAAALDIFDPDPVAGLRRTRVAIPAGSPAWLVEVENVVFNGAGPHGAEGREAEIAVVTRDPAEPHASTLYLYRYEGGALTVVEPAAGVGDDATSIASGDVTGTVQADLVVTAGGDDQMRVFTEGTGDLKPALGPYPTGARPRGASVGDIRGNNVGNEIVVCNSAETSGEVEVFDGEGALLGSYATSGLTGAGVPYASLVTDALWDESPAGTSGDELVIALRSDPASDSILATSTINVFRQSAGGADLDVGGGWPQRYETGKRYESSALSSGDVDGDGKTEVVVGNAGKWARLGNRMAPSIQVFDSPGGNTLSSVRTHWSTGVEQASGIETTNTAYSPAPSVMVADLGPLGPARHPVDATATASHVSTEAAGLARHVTCADCHNVHETTATARSMPATAYGAIKGTWGAAVSNTGTGTAITYTQRRGVRYEYELCLKCHSAYAAAGRTRDIASEVNTRNASTHGLEAPSRTASAPAGGFAAVPAGSFVNSATVWTKDSQLYCIDCHTNSEGPEADGPHTSEEGSLLRAPYFGTLASLSDLLCYTCHKYSVYYTGTDDTSTAMTLFRHPPRTSEPRMHKLHTNDGGFSCRTCHVSHGSASLPHLQNADHGYEHLDTGGACTTACHTGGARRAYITTGTVVAPASLDVTKSALPVLNYDVASITNRDGVSLTVMEGNGVGSDYEITVGFTGVTAMPSSVEYYGRYAGSAGHVVNVYAYNYTSSSYVLIGRWNSTLIAGTFTFPLSDPAFRSAGNEASIRITHSTSGNPNHVHYIDSVWLNP